MPQPASLELLAGATGGVGYFDGIGPTAKFFIPYGIAVDASGMIYVADSGNLVVRKVTPQGTVTTFAGSAGEDGFVDGIGSAARFGRQTSFRGPLALATDASGNVYVSDTYNYSIRKISPAGAVTTFAGTGQSGAQDGPASSAAFHDPFGITVDTAGNVYVGDRGAVRRISPDRMVTTIAGRVTETGYQDGTASEARFGYIAGLALDNAGNVYIADLGNHVIRRLAPNGVVTTIAGSPGIAGNADGAGSAARFNSPYGLTIDPAGNLYVADWGNQVIRKISPSGSVTTIVVGSADCSGGLSTFPFVIAVAMSPSGVLYFADDRNAVIGAVSTSGVVTILAGSINCLAADGTGSQARLGSLGDIAMNAVGNILVVDRSSRTIRTVTLQGQVTSFASQGLPLSAIAVAPGGEVFVAQWEHPLLCRLGPCPPASGAINRMTSSGQMSVVTPAGSSDGTGIQVNSVGGLAIGPGGDLFWTDLELNVVRKMSAAGDMTTVAGVRAVAGSDDGAGAMARFRAPMGIVADAVGNVYVADSGNHSVRKVSPAGTVTTIAGAAGMAGSTDGVGAAARFNQPQGLALDDAGNLYVAEPFTCLVRKVSAQAVVTTVAGTSGRCGVALGTLPGSLDSPGRLIVKGSDLYIMMSHAIVVLRNRP